MYTHAYIYMYTYIYIYIHTLCILCMIYIYIYIYIIYLLSHAPTLLDVAEAADGVGRGHPALQLLIIIVIIITIIIIIMITTLLIIILIIIIMMLMLIIIMVIVIIIIIIVIAAPRAGCTSRSPGRSHSHLGPRPMRFSGTSGRRENHPGRFVGFRNVSDNSTSYPLGR